MTLVPLAKSARDRNRSPTPSPATARKGADGHGAPATEPAAINFARDVHAAASSPSPVAANGRKTPLERALQQPETRVSEEGTNLLRESKPEST
jgi:hypothetical protein